MSETSRNEAHADRPEEVTDPLLWELALGVADAHQPDEDGTSCRSMLCAGQGWPCEAWDSAQRALRAAQTPQDERAAGGSAAATGRTGEQEALTGWSITVPAGDPHLRPYEPDEADRPDAAVSVP